MISIGNNEVQEIYYGDKSVRKVLYNNQIVYLEDENNIWDPIVVDGSNLNIFLTESDGVMTVAGEGDGTTEGYTQLSLIRQKVEPYTHYYFSYKSDGKQSITTNIVEDVVQVYIYGVPANRYLVYGIGENGVVINTLNNTELRFRLDLNKNDTAHKFYDFKFYKMEPKSFLRYVNDSEYRQQLNSYATLQIKNIDWSFFQENHVYRFKLFDANNHFTENQISNRDATEVFVPASSKMNRSIILNPGDLTTTDLQMYLYCAKAFDIPIMTQVEPLVYDLGENIITYNSKSITNTIVRIYVSVNGNALDLSRLKPNTTYRLICQDETNTINRIYLGDNNASNFLLKQTNGLEGVFTTPEVLPSYSNMAIYLYGTRTFTEADLPNIKCAIVNEEPLSSRNIVSYSSKTKRVDPNAVIFDGLDISELKPYTKYQFISKTNSSFYLSFFGKTLETDNFFTRTEDMNPVFITPGNPQEKTYYQVWLYSSIVIDDNAMNEAEYYIYEMEPEDKDILPIGIYEQNNPAFNYYGNWVNETNDLYSGGNGKYTIEYGAATFFYVRGAKSVSIYGIGAKNRGSANIYVDGVLYGVMDQYVDTDTSIKDYLFYTINNLTPVTHKITIESTDAEPLIMDKVIVYDKTIASNLIPIGVGQHDIDRNNDSFDLSANWVDSANSIGYQGDRLLLNVKNAGDYVVFYTEGANRIELYTHSDPERGNVRVYIDGVYFNEYTQRRQEGGRYLYADFTLPDTNIHEIRLQPVFPDNLGYVVMDDVILFNEQVENAITLNPNPIYANDNCTIAEDPNGGLIVARISEGEEWWYMATDALMASVKPNTNYELVYSCDADAVNDDLYCTVADKGFNILADIMLSSGGKGTFNTGNSDSIAVNFYGLCAAKNIRIYDYKLTEIV